MLFRSYAFDDKNEIAYRKQDKAERTQYKFIHGSGGTNPYDSLLLAEKTFMMSNKPNKMMFLITDGVFDSDKNDEVITRIAKRGVLTTQVLICDDSTYNQIMTENETRISRGDKPRYQLEHGTEIFARIKGGKDLLQLAKSVVVGAIKKRKISR